MNMKQLFQKSYEQDITSNVHIKDIFDFQPFVYEWYCNNRFIFNHTIFKEMANNKSPYIKADWIKI